MKLSLFKWGIAPLLAWALLAPIPTQAQASKGKSTGWWVTELLPGVAGFNNSGQMYLLGEVHVLKMESADPRTAGRAIATMNLEAQPDGTATFEGSSSMEVGTWDADGLFTRTGGVWDMKFAGVLNANGTTEYRMSGRGIGGSIDGLHITVTATRASSLPTVPYLFSGTITGPAKESEAGK